MLAEDNASLLGKAFLLAINTVYSHVERKTYTRYTETKQLRNHRHLFCTSTALKSTCPRRLLDIDMSLGFGTRVLHEPLRSR